MSTSLEIHNFKSALFSVKVIKETKPAQAAECHLKNDEESSQLVQFRLRDSHADVK